MSMDIEFGRFFNQLRNMIKKECHQPNNFIYGTIVSVDPLRIDIGGNIILEKEKLFLGQMCRPYKVTIPHTHQIDGMATGNSMAIASSAIGTVIPVSGATPPTEDLSYDTATQEPTYDPSTGKTTRTKIPSPQTIQTTSSSIGAVFTAATGDGVADGGKLVDSSSLNTHCHTIAEHETRDVHFAGSDYEESVTIEIEPKLHVNDKVLMFAFNNNQMYYVAERIE